MTTKFDEIVRTTSDVMEMKGSYLAERVLRKWSEDFVDEDTGDVVSIERKEILFEKGLLIDDKILGEINFHIQCGDINEVKLSNQKRECSRFSSSATLWVVVIKLNGKKKTLYLYANSVETAVAIASDYVEQKYSGSFDFKSIKELDYSNLLSVENDDQESDSDVLDVYKIVVELFENGDSFESSYVVHGTDAEDCKKIIHDFIIKRRIQENASVDFELKLISAKTIPCNYIIEPDFCLQYLDKK